MNNKREITVEDVIELCNAELVCGNLDTVLENFCQDTRMIKAGDVYVGIKGEHHNGNDIYEFPLELGMDKAFNNGISKDDYIMSLQGNTKDLTIYTTKNVDTIDKIKMNLNKFEKFNLAGNETIKIDCDKYESNADKELFNKISQEKINVIDFLHKYFLIECLFSDCTRN